MIRTYFRRRAYGWLRLLTRAAGRRQDVAEPFGYVDGGNALEDLSPGQPADAFHWLPAELREPATHALRQRLVSGLMFSRVLPALLVFAETPQAPQAPLPLPPGWRAHLVGRGLRVDRLSDRLAWWVELASSYGRGVVSGLRLWWSSARGLAFVADGPHAVLLGASAKSALPRPSPTDQWQDWVGWYRSSPLFGGHPVVAVAGSGPSRAAGDGLTLAPTPFPRLRGSWVHARVLAAMLALALRCGLRGLLRGAWWDMLLLSQYMQLPYFAAVPRARRAREYLANNSQIVVRPLWTYLAEQQGSRVALVFYSTNCELFHRPETRNLPHFPGYRGNTWSDFVVWSDEQEAFVRGLSARPVACHRSPAVWLADRAEPLPPLPERYVAVFEVSVFRLAQLARMGIVHPYYCQHTAERFFDDIVAAAAAQGVPVVFKAKRDRGADVPPRVRRLRERLLATPDVYAVHPDFAATRLIQGAAAVISMPYTSTARAALAMGKPTVYYDAPGWQVSAPSRLCRDVAMLSGRGELGRWLSECLGKK